MTSLETMKRRIKTGATIRKLREEQDMLQKELAAKADIAPPYLSQIEKRERGGSTETLSAIAKALGVSVDMLLGTGPPPDDKAVPA